MRIQTTLRLINWKDYCTVAFFALLLAFCAFFMGC